MRVPRHFRREAVESRSWCRAMTTPQASSHQQQASPVDSGTPDYLRSADKPVKHEDEDLLGRSRLAASIYQAICDTPTALSLRIGLYGGWGEGKTSVLNLIQAKAIKDGHVVVWLSPWNAPSADSIWVDLVSELLVAGAKQQSTLSRKSKIKDFFRGKIESVEHLSPLSGVLPGGEAVAGAGLAMLRRFCTPDSKELRRVREALAKHRVIVFIDDLDRADPRVVPKLLLGLRELLDLPAFTFVLAFDRKIIASALNAYHAGFGDGAGFLEKIIDLGFTVPLPTPTEISSCFRAIAEPNCPFIPTETVARLASVLPRNPRKLKSLIRSLVLLRHEAARHGPSELDWTAVLVSRMIRLESEDFAKSFFFPSGGDTNDGSLFRMSYGMPGEASDKPEQILSAAGMDTGHSSYRRLQELVNSWFSHVGVHPTRGIQYLAYFDENPHALTWKEYGDLFELLYRAHDDCAIAAVLTQYCEKRGQSGDRVLGEFIDAALRARRLCLEQGADAIQSEIQEQHISGAAKVRALISRLWDVNKPQIRQHARSSRVFLSMLAQAGAWSHFRVNPNDKSERLEEQQLLMKWAGGDISVMIEVVKGGLPQRPWHLDPPGDEEFWRDLKIRLAGTIAPHCCELLSEPAGMRRVFGSMGNQGLAYTLLDGKGPVWREPLLDQVLGVLRDPEATLDTQQNVIVLTEEICSHATHPDSTSKAIIENRLVVVALWGAMTSRPSQYRFLSKLSEIRRQLVASGAHEEDLRTPDWFEQARAGGTGVR